VFVALAEGKQQLWLRPLDAVTAQPLAGTGSAEYPFWSPDSRSIGFFAEGMLKRIDVAGGPPQVLASAPIPNGGTWNRDGVIVFVPSTLGPLYRVPASGGDPIAITRMDPPRQSHHLFPQFLPDGRHVLYFSWDDPGIYFASFDSPETRRLLVAESPGIYASPGYLLFMRQGVLVAQRFDLALGNLAGYPSPLADSVAWDPTFLIGGFSSSETGILVYRTGGTNRRRLAWFDRSGREIGELLPPEENSPQDLQLSPDGHRVALSRTVQGNQALWLIDASKGVPSRLTFDADFDHCPVWSPDGSRISFYSARKDRRGGIYQKVSSGAGNDELLLESSLEKDPNSWSPDGRFLLYSQGDPKRITSDLWVLPLFGERKPIQFSNTSFSEMWGQFSPDGRWVAYHSNESGIYEVYVQPFPGPGGKWQVSTGGGIEARWRSDGRELFYIALDGKLMAVPIQSSGQTPQAGAPVALFQTRIVGGGSFPLPQQYAVAPNGQRFLINITADESIASPITIVTNWARALKK
jgi:hypothetical protein